MKLSHLLTLVFLGGLALPGLAHEGAAGAVTRPYSAPRQVAVHVQLYREGSLLTQATAYSLMGQEIPFDFTHERAYPVAYVCPPVSEQIQIERPANEAATRTAVSLSIAVTPVDNTMAAVTVSEASFSQSTPCHLRTTSQDDPYQFLIGKGENKESFIMGDVAYTVNLVYDRSKNHKQT